MLAKLELRTNVLALLLLMAGAEARDANAPGKVFDPAGMGLVRTIAPGGDPDAVAFSADGRRLAVAVGTVAVLYETETWREVRRLEGHPNSILGIAWSPDGKLLAAGGLEGAVAMWDTQTGAVRTLPAAHASYVGALAFSPDGRTLVTGSHDGTVRIWDPGEGRERRVLVPAGPAGALCAAFSRDGRRLAIGLGDGEVRLWRAGSWEEDRTLGVRGSGNVLSVTFSRDGARLAIATETTLSVGGLAPGSAEARFEVGTATLGCLAISPDDRYAIAAGGDLAVRVHDLLRKGEEVAKLQHHTGALSGVAVRPDGRCFVTIGHDRHLKVWGRVSGGMARIRPKGFCGIRVQADATGRVVISDVIAGTAARAAGMQAGDVLRSVGGLEIHNTTESVDKIGSYLEGDEVEFVVERGGESKAMKFRLGKRPDDLEN